MVPRSPHAGERSVEPHPTSNEDLQRPRYTSQRFTTRAASVEQRKELWERYSEHALFSFQASTHADEGLLATQANLQLPGMRLAEITAANHVIDRTPKAISTMPWDGIVLAVSLAGEGFFYQRDEFEQVRPGDAVVYDIDRPFMFGFSSSLHLALIEFPREHFQELAGGQELIRPRVIHLRDHERIPGLARNAVHTIRRAVQQPSTVDLSTEQTLVDLHAILIGSEADHSGSGYVLAAKDFIRSNLDDHQLSLGRIASAINVSERHLSRVFAEQNLTVAGYVQEQRLTRAREFLTDPECRSMSVGHVAWLSGFGSAPHFARAFKSRFGATPTQVRARSGSAPSRPIDEASVPLVGDP